MNLSQLKQAVKTAPQELPNAFGQAKKPATLSKANTSSDICTEISQSLPVIRFPVPNVHKLLSVRLPFK